MPRRAPPMRTRCSLPRGTMAGKHQVGGGLPAMAIWSIKNQLRARGHASTPRSCRGPRMVSELPTTPERQVHIETFDGTLGRRIIDMHIWAVREGLSGTSAYDLFDHYCRRL